MTDPVLAARAAIGVAARTKNPEAQLKARRDLTAAKLERHVREALASAPPMTDAQRQRIASLLTGGAR